MFKRNMAASCLQLNRHRQIADRLHVLTSDYTTDTVVWTVIMLNDVPTKDRATCFSKTSVVTVSRRVELRIVPSTVVTVFRTEAETAVFSKYRVEPKPRF